MAIRDWTSIEWVLESCMKEGPYDPASTSVEEQQALREYMLPRMDEYLSSQDLDIHLNPEYETEKLYFTEAGDVSVRQMTRFLPLPFSAAEWFTCFYLPKGRTRVFAGDESVLMEEGDVVIIPPGISFMLPVLDRNCSVYEVRLKKKAMKNYFGYLKQQHDAGVFFKTAAEKEADRTYLHFISGASLYPRSILRLIDLFDTDDTKNPDLFPVLLEAGLIELCGSVNYRMGALIKEKSPEDAVIRYIEQHFEDVALPELEEVFSLSRRQLSRIILDKTGMSFTEYRTDVRLRHIADLLRNTRLPVVDIIEASGFHHNNVFYALFDNRFHMTPTAYRETNPFR